MNRCATCVSASGQSNDQLAASAVRKGASKAGELSRIPAVRIWLASYNCHRQTPQKPRIFSPVTLPKESRTMTEKTPSGDKPSDQSADKITDKPIPPPSSAAAGASSAGQTPDMPATTPNTGEYGVDQMKYLTDLEHVRERSGMYIGNTRRARLAPPGLRSRRQLDRRSHGRLRHDISRHRSTSTARSRSPTTAAASPSTSIPNLGMSALEGVMTMLKFGGKFDKQAYKTSGGLHGIGVKVVNFLSEWCEVEVRRDGHVYQQEYERGMPTGRRAPHRHGRRHRHADHLQARLRRCSATRSSTTTSSTAACRNWPFSTAA